MQFVLIDEGDRIISAVEEKAAEPAAQFGLYQNHPNPFNSQTRITYALSQASAVTLKMYDLAGREVTVIIDNKKEAAGRHEVLFDTANLPSGVYFYSLHAGTFTETRKMVLIR